MSHNARLETIRQFLRTHPGISKPAIPDTPKVERYLLPNGMPIVLDPVGKKYNNIWVKADSLDTKALHDIECELRPNASEGASRPNQPLYTDPLLKKVDLVCFKVTSLKDAKRVVEAVINHGGRP